jgi:hypothetical protein
MNLVFIIDYKPLTKVYIAIFCLILSTISFAQTGSIKGFVKEKDSGESIPVANVVILGTNTGTITDFDGNFELNNLQEGSYDLQVSFISYKTETITGVKVAEKQLTEILVELESESQMLKEVEISAEVKKENENLLLLERQNSTQIVQQIGAQELERKGASDVASALAKVSGICKTENNNDVYVRGLGDRYNSTTLNQLPIPSNNPEQKNISLDIFSTGIVEYISIDKVYNTRFFGDFAGGNVDIASKDFKDSRFLKLGIGTNINTNCINKNRIPMKQGPDYFGLTSSKPPESISNYEFSNPLDPRYISPIGTSLTISGGNKFIMGADKHFNFFGSFSFDNDVSFKEGITKNVNSSGYPSKDLRFKDYSYNTNTTGMINTGYRANKNNKINYNLVFINSSDNSSKIYEGTIIDIADFDNGLLTRYTYEKNTILINQLLGHHEINNSSKFRWGLAYNRVASDIPDRLQNTFRMLENEEYVFGQNQITDNHRYFHFLNENEIALNTVFEKKFLNDKNNDYNKDDYKLKLEFGYTAKYKKREFEATQYNFRIHSDQRNAVIDPYNLSSFFNQTNLEESNYFRIETFRGSSQVPNVLDPQIYGGTQMIHGVFLNTEYHFNKKMVIIMGFRGEYIMQEVRWNTQLDPSDKSDLLQKPAFLPVIVARYKINEKQNLRLGVSKTYTLPQFKERALFIYEDVTQVKIGNPDLYESDDYNLDLKWEIFPGLGEIISLGAFGKYILNPINEVTISSATNDISFVNTGDWGYVAGFELEIRKEFISTYKNKLISGLNASYMHTDQELSSDKVKEETKYAVQFTHENASFTGASDWLLNADITYIKIWNENKNKIMASLSYNFFSDRIYALGTNQRGDIIEKSFSSLDFILKTEIANFEIGLNIKNILNPNIETYQANLDRDITVIAYKRGINVSLGLSYVF